MDEIQYDSKVPGINCARAHKDPSAPVPATIPLHLSPNAMCQHAHERLSVSQTTFLQVSLVKEIPATFVVGYSKIGWGNGFALMHPGSAAMEHILPYI